MHLSNGIICPVTGAVMITAMGIAAFWAFKKGKQEFTKQKILPAVMLTALVFALQMINFSIPLTGSSGHVIGGVLLAALLGPNVGFLAMSLILIIQSLFFADGGLLAYGCNVFNMGFLACFVVYPFIYKPLSNKPVLASILASIAALQLGSIAVVIEGALSGSIALFNCLNFAALMQAIHLPIGLVEGAISAIAIIFVKSAGMKKSAYSFGLISLILAGLISNYACNKPDGLEWALLNISDYVNLQTQNILYIAAEFIQSKTALLRVFSAGNLTGVFLAAISALLFCFALANKKLKNQV